MKVVNAMICKPDDGELEEKKCPTEEEIYSYILFYTGFMLAYEMIHTFREIPFARLSANAEISIASDVYYHVQSLSLAYHLSRETGKVIRIVSKGSQSFTNILRMILFTLFGLVIQIVMTLIVSLTIFSWQFTMVQLFALVVYVFVTYILTERRAKGFKEQMMAD